VPRIRISVRASFCGATLTARPAVPREYFLASMSDPKLLALMIPSLGALNKSRWKLLWKPKWVFHDSIPGENGVGLRFRAEFFNIFNHPNFGNPNNILNSPLFGRSTQTLVSSLGFGAQMAASTPFTKSAAPAPSNSHSNFSSSSTATLDCVRS
jgi:hypothetical protein